MSGFRPGTDHLRLRDDNVEPPIVILRGNALDLLRREREANRQDRVHPGERRDGAVEVALAVAEAAAGAVEGGGGSGTWRSTGGTIAGSGTACTCGSWRGSLG